MRFDLTDLQLFRHVAEAGSITAGAERAHLALASASARLRGMEDLLGVPLLLRKRRGVDVTEAGRTLLHHARVILGQVENMRGDLAGYAQGLKGQIRLLCNTSALSEFLPQVLAGYMRAHPQVHVEVEEKRSGDIVQALLDGVADIGIVADSADSAGLYTFPFRDDELVVVAAPEHPLLAAPGAGIAFAQTLAYDFVGLAGDSALQQHLGEHAAKLGRRLRYRLRLLSFDAICRVVESGAGIAIIPAAAARRYENMLAIRQIGLLDPWARRRLLVCVRRHEDLSAHARELVGALAA